MALHRKTNSHRPRRDEQRISSQEIPISNLNYGCIRPPDRKTFNYSTADEQNEWMRPDLRLLFHFFFHVRYRVTLQTDRKRTKGESKRA